MKRTSIWMICLVLFTQVSFKAFGAQPERINTVIALPDHITSAAKVYDSLYLLGDKGIYKWMPGHNEVETVEDQRLAVSVRYTMQRPEDDEEGKLWDHLALKVFSDGREVLLLHPYTLEVTALHPSGSRLPRYSLPIEKLSYDKEGETTLRDIKQLILIDGRIYMLLGTDQAMDHTKNCVAVYDFGLDAFTILPISGAQGIYAGKQGELLVLRTSNNDTREQQNAVVDGLYAYSLNSDTPEKLLFSQNKDVGGYVYDQSQQRVLYSHGGIVFSLNEGGAEEKTAYIPAGNVSSQSMAFLLAGGTYVMVENESLISRSINGVDMAEQVVLRYMGNLDQELVRKYSAHMPNVSVIPAGDGVVDNDRIAASMIGRDSGIDLYILNDLLTFYAARDKGYAGAMNTSAPLVASSARLHPAIRDVVMKDGQLLGFPILMQEDLWSINQSAWQRFDLGKPPQTLTGFFKLLETWEQNYADENLSYSFTDSQHMGFYVRYIIQSYILNHASETEAIDFKAPALFEALSELESYRQLLSPSDEQLQRNMDALYNVIYTYSFASLSNARVDDEIYSLYLPPAIKPNETPVYTARPTILILNQLGTQKERALDFIDFYVDNMDIETRYKLFTDLNEPMRRSGYESDLAQQQLVVENARKTYDAASEVAVKRDLENQLKREESKLQRYQDDWLISPDTIDTYRSLTEYLVFPSSNAISLMRGEESLLQDINQFVQGLVPLERFLDELNRKARLIYLEGN